MMTRLYIFRKSVFTMAFAVQRIARNNIRAHQSTQRQILAVALYLFVACIAAQADPFDLIQNTYLVAVRQRQEHAGTIEYLSRGGYELAGGKGINFAQWYQPKVPDIQFDFMTQINPRIGLLWGFSSGESGEKYIVQPSARAGFILQQPLSGSTNVSLSFTQLFGGNFRERPCTADYGEIGGLQSVNCRLAATTLRPSDTLQYLVNARPIDQTVFRLRLNSHF